MHAKYKYKMAIRNATNAFEWDLDDELSLSQCYIRRDMDKFLKKWQKRFSKRGSAPAHIAGLTEAQCIAERFDMSFSEHSFDSYSHSESVTQLCARLRTTDVMSSCSNTFSVSLACLCAGGFRVR